MTDPRDERTPDKAKDGLATHTEGEIEADRPSGWAGIDDALGGTSNRPAGPDHDASTLDDETPGSQGEIEAGSEGDFGGAASVKEKSGDT